MLPNLGPTELIVIVGILVLLFGAKRIPELAKGLGSGVREFRKGSGEEVKWEDEEENKAPVELNAAKVEAREFGEPVAGTGESDRAS